MLRAVRSGRKHDGSGPGAQEPAVLVIDDAVLIGAHDDGGLANAHGAGGAIEHLGAHGRGGDRVAGDRGVDEPFHEQTREPRIPAREGELLARFRGEKADAAVCVDLFRRARERVDRVARVEIRDDRIAPQFAKSGGGVGPAQDQRQG